ncbi:MAG: rod shape-determining protein RodA [Dethiobacter sp.]|nr:rod shape-determining protein RodA [Dethiobacter sp.]
MFDRRIFRNFDFLLLFTAGAIMMVSLIVISSATLVNPTGDPNYFVKRQAVRFAIGLVVMLVVVSIDYTQFYRFSSYLYVFNLGLLLAVFFVGREGGGAQRWIDLKVFDLQPSEFAKVIIIISLARHLVSREGNFDSIFSIIPSFMHVALPMALIFLQPDLGTSLVFIAILYGMLFIAGARVRHLLLYAVVGIGVGFPILWSKLKLYQKMRLTVFINPESDPLVYGYQLIQSMIAIGSGGLRGKGLFEGTQSQLEFLPAQHTDFIFSVLAEEMGFIGGVVLLLLFLLLIYRVIRTASLARDTFGALICIGVASMLTFQVLVNIGMTISIMPVTGLPLPFMSYGGSQVLANLIALGLVLNIGMRRHKLMF